jgi:vacuolar-type H+-ATPase subunit D/Vma8
MTAYEPFTKIRRKLKDRQFHAEKLSDGLGFEIPIKKEEKVYLQSEVDEVLDNLKEKFGEIVDKIYSLQKEKEALKLEVYRLQKTLKRVNH